MSKNFCQKIFASLFLLSISSISSASIVNVEVNGSISEDSYFGDGSVFSGLGASKGGSISLSFSYDTEMDGYVAAPNVEARYQLNNFDFKIGESSVSLSNTYAELVLVNEVFDTVGVRFFASPIVGNIVNPPIDFIFQIVDQYGESINGVSAPDLASFNNIIANKYDAGIFVSDFGFTSYLIGENLNISASSVASSVPEPGSFMLLCTGLVVLPVARKFSHKVKA